MIKPPTSSVSSALSSMQSPRKVLYVNPSEKQKPKQSLMPSRIPPEASIILNIPTRPDNSYESEFCEVDNCWKTIVFPRKFPDSRDDVKYLDKWLAAQLSKCAKAATLTLPGNYCGGSGEDMERSVVVALNQLTALDLGFSEMIRQVTLNCSERGELMHRMWYSSHDLFTKVYSDMAVELRALKYKLFEKVGLLLVIRVTVDV